MPESILHSLRVMSHNQYQGNISTKKKFRSLQWARAKCSCAVSGGWLLSTRNGSKMGMASAYKEGCVACNDCCCIHSYFLEFAGKMVFPKVVVCDFEFLSDFDAEFSFTLTIYRMFIVTFWRFIFAIHGLIFQPAPTPSHSVVANSTTAMR